MSEKCSSEDEVSDKQSKETKENEAPESNEEIKVEKPEEPIYANELSIFQKETLEKIEEFRVARRNWVTSYANKETNTDVNEGSYKTNIYRGRCSCLRRIGFKTTFLRRHRKTVRPLKFFTFKTKLASPYGSGSLTESRESLLINDKSKPRRTHKKRLSRNKKIKKKISDLQYKTSEESASKTKLLKKRSEEKRRKKSKEKENESDESSNKSLKPSKKAIKKLKIAKMKSMAKEPYTCSDGRDLTVVLKGFCPNYKNVLTKSKLRKVCKDYTKLTDKEIESEETVLCNLTDSLEIHQKQIIKKKICSSNKAGKNKKVCDEDSELTDENVKSEKIIFCQVKDSLEIYKKKIDEKKIFQRREGLIQPDSKAKPIKSLSEEKLNETYKAEIKEDDRKVSLVTLYENVDKNKSNLALTKEQLIKMGRMIEETVILKL